MSKILFFINLFFKIFSKKENKCEICDDFVNLFSNGLKETENKTYEGGTSFGQSKKLLDFSNSELRLITILESVCDSSTEKKTCNSFIEKYEDEIEKWFKYFRTANIELRNFLCVETSQACCPIGFFGKDCKECLGKKENILCNGHGKCHGDGTRRGNGSCLCDEGYTGSFCDKCTDEAFMDENGNCNLCHESCSGPCINETVQGCQGDCKKGWSRDENGLCIDDDECKNKTHDCKIQQFCENVEGKFKCRDCIGSCLKCSGPKPTDCELCSPGYEKNDENICVDINECERENTECKAMTYCKNTHGSYECLKCNAGCKEGCSGPSLSDCFDCESGFKKREKGCEDIDECQNSGVCAEGQYCRNKFGGFDCSKCDKSCVKCHGPGPHSCDSCIKGYLFYEGYCQDIRKIVESKRDKGEL